LQLYNIQNKFTTVKSKQNQAKRPKALTQKMIHFEEKATPKHSATLIATPAAVFRTLTVNGRFIFLNKLIF